MCPWAGHPLIAYPHRVVVSLVKENEGIINAALSSVEEVWEWDTNVNNNFKIHRWTLDVVKLI